MAEACSGNNARVVAIARSWMGTPYLHQASCRGAGTDCLGLIRGIWRELFGAEPEAVPAYAEDWPETGPREMLAAACARHLLPVTQPVPGDVLLMRVGVGAAARHLGVLDHAQDGRQVMIHAYSGRGVVQSVLQDNWPLKLAGSFRFPEAV